jgi:hypothetical protein
MGTLITIECARGYQSEGFCVSYGFGGPEKGAELMRCQVCVRVGASGVLTKEKRCSHCRSRRVRVFEEEVPAGPLACPACGRPTSVAVESGLWD